MSYLFSYPEVVLGRMLQHAGMVLGAMAVALLIALPLGFWLQRHKKAAGAVLGVLGVLYTIPSIALMIFLIPIFGLNAWAVIAALVLYDQILIVRNVIAGLDGIDPAVLEAARGMGMRPLQVAWRVQLPLALPVILAGARIAAIVTVAVATLGAKFGAGGLGTLLFDGIAQSGRYDKIVLGALLVGLLAFALNRALLALERRVRTA